MKKTLATLALCALFVSMSVAGATPQANDIQPQQVVLEPKNVEWTGEISGSYGVGRSKSVV